MTNWEYFASQYRREHGREPDEQNPQHLLLAAWYTVGGSDAAFVRALSRFTQRLATACDCTASEIRWIDEASPHVAINKKGWFCMGCLTEFVPLHTENRMETNEQD